MKKILIVDDHTDVRELVRASLGSGEYIILQAENGEKAIEIVINEKPDLILMDIMMPGNIDGIEATQRLKSNPGTKDSFILMLTAKGQKIDFERGFEAGADGYIIKPFSPIQLINKIEEILK